MLSDSEKNHRSDIASSCLLVSGFVFVLSALLYNEFLLAYFDSSPPLLQPTVQKIRLVQISFLAFGLILIALSELLRRSAWLSILMGKTWATNLLLIALVVFLPLSCAELALKPFMLKTTIFVRDNELGWKLKPNTEDAWYGVIVRINGKGLRGPELAYSKPSGVKRILYLGDSIPFGHRLKNHEETFPYRAEALLEDGFGREIETINAGVEGYSPWQEYLYLVKEGIRYDPDLLIVSFVLNDVVEQFGLKKFGGTHEGVQLHRTVASTYDWFVRTSSIAYYAREIGARIRFGRDVQGGAQKLETLQVQSLVHHADRPDVQRAWKSVLGNLGDIFTFSREKNIPVVLVVFPYRFQFEDINAFAVPQKVVSRYAIDHQVPVIDLLPLLYEKATRQGVKPTDYFLDINHLSALGHEVVAEIITDFIQREGSIAGAQEKKRGQPVP